MIVPKDLIENTFSRSSGPGGQNVNKLNTKATIKFSVSEAEWLTDKVKERLIEQRALNISYTKDKEVFFTVQSQRNRTQH